MILHCYEIGPDIVIAHDEADALRVWSEHTGKEPTEEPRRVPGFYRWAIGDEQERTATEWVIAKGRGFLC